MLHSDKRSLEQKYRSAVDGLYARLRSNYDFLYEKFGEQGLQIIADMSRRYGLEVVEKARKRVQEGSIESIGEYLLRIFNNVSVGGERLTEVTEWCGLCPQKEESNLKIQFILWQSHKEW